MAIAAKISLGSRPQPGRGMAFRGDDGLGHGLVGCGVGTLELRHRLIWGQVFRGAEVRLEDGVDEAAGYGVGEKHGGDAARFRTFLGLAAPLEVAAKLTKGVEAQATVCDAPNYGLRVRDGLAVGDGHAPFLADLLGDAPGTECGERDGEPALQGPDLPSDFTEGRTAVDTWTWLLGFVVVGEDFLCISAQFRAKTPFLLVSVAGGGLLPATTEGATTDVPAALPGRGLMRNICSITLECMVHGGAGFGKGRVTNMDAQDGNCAWGYSEYVYGNGMVSGQLRVGRLWRRGPGSPLSRG